MRGAVFALLGAECTGKTTLAQALVVRLCGSGVKAALVPEYLRLWCEEQGRTPSQHEQILIARHQTQLIQAAADDYDVVIADTTSLLTAVYSETVFGDCSLYEEAERVHRAMSKFTLLTALDLPWVADGIQRDGPHVREPVDALIRAALMRAGAPFALVSGEGNVRVEQAFALIQHALDEPSRKRRLASTPKWRWICENCDDGDCEQHWLARAEQANDAD